MRLRASANVQNTSARYRTARMSSATLTAVLTLLLLIPKTASVVSMCDRQPNTTCSQESPAQRISDAEEDEDDQSDDDRHRGNHRHDAGAALVHSALALRAPGGLSRSATR